MLATINVQHHAGQRSGLTAVAMFVALALMPHERCGLQGRLHSGVVNVDLMQALQLLVKMLALLRPASSASCASTNSTSLTAEKGTFSCAIYTPQIFLLTGGPRRA